jgi:hypothetical protein
MDHRTQVGDHRDPAELPLCAALVRELALALHSIRYGTIELVIHDGRVVQLERREKVRFASARGDDRP